MVDDNDNDHYEIVSRTGESPTGRRADTRAGRRHTRNEILIIPLKTQSSSSCSGHHRRAPRQERGEMSPTPRKKKSSGTPDERPRSAYSQEREEILIYPGKTTPGARHPSLTPHLPQDREEILIYPGKNKPSGAH
ncbi:hypothetical protein EMPG_13272 [Blastomyces silverae]|uniref:Uncharacterized protein n=1 Tax=Blastomyces silverae TaxID=2060906 RepID=A0A0H1BQU7_9EURO|nr:hypothetical protein EMPG_13272 [Blastomyces silverae]